MQKWKRNYESWKKWARHWLIREILKSSLARNRLSNTMPTVTIPSAGPEVRRLIGRHGTRWPCSHGDKKLRHDVIIHGLNVKTPKQKTLLYSTFPRPDVVCYNLLEINGKPGRCSWISSLSPRATFLASLCKCCKTKHQRSSKQSVHCHMSNQENYEKFKHQLLIWALPELSLLPFHCPTARHFGLF